MNITNAIGKLRRLKKSKMPSALTCTCVSLWSGCKCGAIQAERALKAQKKKRKPTGRRDCAAINYLPAEGEIVIVRRPSGANIDHGGIPLAVWHACEGKQFEVLLAIWDEHNESAGLALLDIASIGKMNDHWFPLDGIELP